MAHIQDPTQIHLDAVAVQRLGQECTRAGMDEPLVISEAGVCSAGVLRFDAAADSIQRARHLQRLAAAMGLCDKTTPRMATRDDCRKMLAASL